MADWVNKIVFVLSGAVFLSNLENLRKTKNVPVSGWICTVFVAVLRLYSPCILKNIISLVIPISLI